MIELQQHYKNSLTMLSQTTYQAINDNKKSKIDEPVIIEEDKEEEEHVLYKVPDPLDYRQLDLEEF